MNLDESKPDWEELYRLASLVGTDSANAKSKFKQYTDQKVNEEVNKVLDCIDGYEGKMSGLILNLRQRYLRGSK